MLGVLALWGIVVSGVVRSKQRELGAAVLLLRSVAGGAFRTTGRSVNALPVIHQVAQIDSSR
ncbi:hypothetical protein C5C66_05145 [Rathayibacter toxicus]|nr:hypothetical protein TI83_05335 [Rathayibacter toxicus]PPG21608.1 hypothetical protein C5D15_05130 [Rathayibacter toxicus]PPG46570.1 hypothetical protein C5D16_05105 [Rathayibacter toxicus]PPH57453.1 hypothetical protein C5D30_05130 [Rathayibacter toxicus]PPH67797.1 hypothetical protein C5D01_05170 [Rathayibacter toxicus]